MNRDVAVTFLRCFCDGDIDGVAATLSDDFSLEGPLFRFDSRDAYLARLKKDPPEPCPFRVISISETADTVAVFYDYEKRSGTVTIAQLFKLDGDKIVEIRLVFDPQPFSRNRT